MSWQPIDFHRIIDLDHKIVDQLERFLQEKENRLAIQIVNVIPQVIQESSLSSLISEGPAIKLQESAEKFSKMVRRLQEVPNNEIQINFNPKQVLKNLNAILWEFTEILEGCVSELFQQVKQVPIDRWHLSIFQVVQSIKDILIHYIEDLVWIIRRLEKPLKDYCHKFHIHSESHWWDRFLLRDSFLDRNLLANLNKTEKYLKMQYEAFQQNYQEFMLLNIKTEDNLQKMKFYPILAILDISDQNLYVDVYRLLNMIELNPHAKKEVAGDTIRALKNLTSFDNIFHVMRLYYQEIKDAFFKGSLEWKLFDRQKENYQENVEKLKLKNKDLLQELHDLIRTMSRYRTFILKNDSNPYIRSRWGFSEWIVGPEPLKAKKMLHIIYSAEELERLFKRFQDSIVLDPIQQEATVTVAQEEIENLLHETRQPLISHAMMKNRIEKLLEELKICDEIGNPHMEIITYFEDILSKTMREDWRYHVLHDFPLFNQIYHIHQGLVKRYEDPTHAFRMERFQLFFDQIEGWVEKGDVYSHVHEIQLDINDMKTYLQDFLATVQRTLKEKSHDPFIDETLSKYAHQLLEYRYLFGKFFFHVMSKNKDGMQLRNQFLFVNQYFESIDNVIQEQKLSLKEFE